MKKNCIIYSRVSTTKQDAKNQIIQLKKYAKQKKYKIIDMIEEVESSKSKREKLNKLLNQNNYNILLVYALDRISRNGLFETINILQHLSDRGISFESYTEPILNTKNEMVRTIMLAVMSALAKAEREKISQRTKIGIARARLEGKKIGRPESKTTKQLLNKIQCLRLKKIGYQEIGNKLNLTKSRVQYLCNKYKIKKSGG